MAASNELAMIFDRAGIRYRMEGVPVVLDDAGMRIRIFEGADITLAARRYIARKLGIASDSRFYSFLEDAKQATSPSNADTKSIPEL